MTTVSPHYLMWFRRDLRIHDNTALTTICQHANDNNAKLSAVFFITPKQWLEHQQSLSLVDHILRTLPILTQDLTKQLHIRLHVMVVDDFQQSTAQLMAFCQAQNISKVACNYEYELNERLRDEQASNQLQSLGCELLQYHDQCIVQPLSVVTKDNNMYKVFTPFYRNWQKLLDASPIVLQHPEPVTANLLTMVAEDGYDHNDKHNDKHNDDHNHDSNDNEKLSAVCHNVLMQYRQNWQQALSQVAVNQEIVNQEAASQEITDSLLASSRQRFAAGETNACYQLDQFVAEPICHYDVARDVPILQSTSDLSPYLAIGSISPRLCYVQALKALHGDTLKSNSHSKNIYSNNADVTGQTEMDIEVDIETDITTDVTTDIDTANGSSTDINRWISELAWRDFYRHVLVTRPELIKHTAFNVATDQKVHWSYDLDEFAKWCAGMTGFPFIDSAMRCLNATGFMHNRLRMVTAMFLTKDLLIDWRWGERYFMHMLIDGDFASNNGGWQWSASTGTDAAPYFRIMNPFSQGKTHDVDAEFIKKWLPELRSVPAKILHDEIKLRAFLKINRSIDYPMPMVEHKKVRLVTIAMFKG